MFEKLTKTASNQDLQSPAKRYLIGFAYGFTAVVCVGKLLQKVTRS